MRKKIRRVKRTVPSINRLLVIALNAEKKAREFYLNAAAQAGSDTGKNMFKELADFEARHYKYVNSIINARKNKIDLNSIRFTHAAKEAKPEVSGEFEPNKDEIIAVLNMGIKGEKMAQQRYLKIAHRIREKEGQRIFEGLAEDERRHLAVLESELYHLSNKGTIIWE